MQVDELLAQAAASRKPGTSSQAVTVTHPGHVLYPLDESSEADLQVMAAFVPADVELEES